MWRWSCVHPETIIPDRKSKVDLPNTSPEKLNQAKTISTDFRLPLDILHLSCTKPERWALIINVLRQYSLQLLAEEFCFLLSSMRRSLVFDRCYLWHSVPFFAFFSKANVVYMYKACMSFFVVELSSSSLSIIRERNIFVDKYFDLFRQE